MVAPTKAVEGEALVLADECKRLAHEAGELYAEWQSFEACWEDRNVAAEVKAENYRDHCAIRDKWHAKFTECSTAIDRLAALSTPPQEAPIDMVLHCPACGKQHIDAPEDKRWIAGADSPPWANPPHRSHLCHGCGHIWRPADVPTNGVSAVKTTGKADSPVATATRPEGVSQAEDAQRLTDERFYLQRKGVLPEWDDETSGHRKLQDALACVQYSKSTPDRPLRIIARSVRVVMDQAAIDASRTPATGGDA